MPRYGTNEYVANARAVSAKATDLFRERLHAFDRFFEICIRGCKLSAALICTQRFCVLLADFVCVTEFAIDVRVVRRFLRRCFQSRDRPWQRTRARMRNTEKIERDASGVLRRASAFECRCGSGELLRSD